MKPRVVILGAGFAGHTAALHLSDWIDESAEITVISPRNRFTWFPSLIWVATGTMPEDEVHFQLAPVYAKLGIDYIDARATQIDVRAQTVTFVSGEGHERTIGYDYLVNATGPYLNFDATPGLGPAHGTTTSVCSVEHAVETRERYLEIVRDLKAGHKRRLVIGVGHPTATCEGAAFEYLMNVDADLRARGLRENAELVWLTNEPEPGDFGVDGIEAKKNGRLVTGAGLVRMLLDEAGVRPLIGAGVTKAEPGRLTYAQVGSDPATIDYDFAMLIPQFRGIPIAYRDGENDITATMTMPNGFMRVDADYEAKTYEQYKATDWPALYRSPHAENLYAAGIAFAPPHPMSRGKKSPDGVPIVAMAPRTGMASGIMGRTVAANIRDQIEGKPATHHARMSEMPAACIASMGKSIWSGSAASILMVPVARDFEKYPRYGRDLSLCDVDVGLGGAWTKRMLHTVFMWKLQAKPGWQMIPE